MLFLLLLFSFVVVVVDVVGGCGFVILLLLVVSLVLFLACVGYWVAGGGAPTVSITHVSGSCVLARVGGTGFGGPLVYISPPPPLDTTTNNTITQPLTMPGQHNARLVWNWLAKLGCVGVCALYFH